MSKNNKLLELKKSLILFGMITSGTTALTGCSDEVNIPETAITTNSDISYVYNSDPGQLLHYLGGETVRYNGEAYTLAYNPESEYVTNDYTPISYENGLKTSSLFFVRLDGKIYLTTKITDKNASNIISKYYAIDTGEFIGQTLEINWYARAISQMKNVMPKKSKKQEYFISLDNDINDWDYFNGEYGLGKNLFQGSIISASEIFDEEKLNKNKIELLLSDPFLVESYIEEYEYPHYISFSKEDYTFVPGKKEIYYLIGDTEYIYYVLFQGETSYYYNELQKYLIDDGNETKEIIGYRSSINSLDNGYNYFYDILSSEYMDISVCKILDEENAYSSTLNDIRKETSIENVDYYNLSDLKVISTKNMQYFVEDGEFEKYYIASLGERYIESSGEYCPIDGELYEYSVINNDENITAIGTRDGSSICISKNDKIISTPNNSNYNSVISLKDFLEENSLSGYIKDTYSNAELNMLILKICSLNNEKEQLVEEQINANDIIVIDTNKDNMDSVIKSSESDKKYYILVFDENRNIYDNPILIYYNTCNNDGTAMITPEKDMVLIRTLETIPFSATKRNNSSKLECILTLKDALQEIGMDDFLKEEYSINELQTLENTMNELQILEDTEENQELSEKQKTYILN